MQALLALLVLPLMLLNVFGGVASGIWLGILGEWWAIGYGILGLLVSHFGLAFALTPALACIAAAVALVDKDKPILAAPLVLLGNLYIAALMTVWCLLILWFFVSPADNESFVPLIIWSYGVALGPWMHMAQKEFQMGGGDAESISIFFAQVAYITVAIVVMISRVNIVELAMVFGSVMLLGLLAQLATAIALLRGPKRTEAF